MGTINEEIKQEKFDSELSKCSLNVIYTANWINSNTTVLFKEHGILAQHYNVLRIVRGKKGKPTSPGQIIEVLLDKGRDLTRLVDKLVKIDYLERRVCPTNRRKVEIFITPIGLEVTRMIEDKINEWFSSSLNLEESEAIQLNDLLDKLRG